MAQTQCDMPGAAIRKIAIVGTVGVPAKYGGFETLAENLVNYCDDTSAPCQMAVYCSRADNPHGERFYRSAELRYLPFRANGAQSLLYDIASIISAIWRGSDACLLLGVSGALALPLVRLLSRVRVITNIDGIEWRRAKWGFVAKLFLRVSEWAAVRFSNTVIADNDVIREHLLSKFNVTAEVIAYGGDHALSVDPKPIDDLHLPRFYGLSICRIEPENNIEMILQAHARAAKSTVAIVGNWSASAYGRSLRAKYGAVDNLLLLDPIYDLGKLHTLRSGMHYYVHGHSAGGTNPSLVEAMHFGKPIIAFDCRFNRVTTEGCALYFGEVSDLMEQIARLGREHCEGIGEELRAIALRRYTWSIVARQYFDLLTR